MKKIFVFLMLVCLGLGLIGLTGALAADNIEGALKASGDSSGLSNPSGGLPVTIGKIIQAFIALLGIVFVVLVVYAGFSYMLSQGDKDKAKKARDLIINASIGLAIVLAAYAITSFIVSSLLNATH